MITNLPDAEALTATALRLYFSAWNRLRGILSDWDARIPDASLVGEVPASWQEEAEGYLDDCQSDLQATIAIIQQSNELALKARLCAVSPYLLLLEGQLPLSNEPKDLDFFDLRTLDAQRLPQAVNTLCPTPLPHSFVTRYDALRRIRNRYTHLGEAGKMLRPVAMMHDLLDQYVELWPDRGWLRDRLRAAEDDRTAGFGDKFWNPAYGVLQMWPGDMGLMSPARFRRLFGVDPDAVSCLCHACRKNAETRMGLVDLNMPTAYREEHGTIRCLACHETYQPMVEACERRGCVSTMIGTGEHDGLCYQCGHSRGGPDNGGEDAVDSFARMTLLPQFDDIGPDLSSKT